MKGGTKWLMDVFTYRFFFVKYKILQEFLASLASIKYQKKTCGITQLHYTNDKQSHKH